MSQINYDTDQHLYDNFNSANKMNIHFSQKFEIIKWGEYNLTDYTNSWS